MTEKETNYANISTYKNNKMNNKSAATRIVPTAAAARGTRHAGNAAIATTTGIAAITGSHIVIRRLLLIPTESHLLGRDAHGDKSAGSRFLR